MAVLSLQDIFVRFGGPWLLEGATLNLERGERVCLLGRNGEGKSTLLKIAAGLLTPDAGEVVRARAVTVAMMPQMVPTEWPGCVLEVVRAGTQPHQESWQRDVQAAKVISQMDLDPTADCAALSGGMKRRVLLAQALAAEPDVLLLDEPTNHLDVDSIQWMENALLRTPGAMLFVTHDRAFLRRLATRIVELDRGRLRSWACGYDLYVQRKAAALEAEEQQQAVFDKKLAQEEAWLRQGVKARRTRNEGRVRELKQLRAARAARREVGGPVKATLQEADRSGYKVLTAKNLGRSYDGRWLFRGLDTDICRGDKVGILGPNGCGKSTLIRVLLGQEESDEGHVAHGTKLEVAYFDQLRSVLDETRTVFDTVADGHEYVMVDGRRKHVIGYLEEFLFTPDRARSPVRVLSGGERSRLLLAKLFAQPSNVLVLDEPTNDLDIETLELIEALVVEYTGTVLLVSHDREFLNEAVTSTLVFEGEGVVREYPGGYDDWVAQRKVTAPITLSGDEPAKPAASSTRKLANKERKELQEIPGRITALEAELDEWHRQMADPGFYKGTPAAIQAATARAAEIPPELDRLYLRWAELEADG
ncbi:MAG: ATP-binding cassette domain-containing protein [Kiritimatiellia bacterium]|jgi:ATP-binding cassette subfamily F protein uup|nr:ATP-binding cassette domain-containing protein [Kiritimatiellia bacterium]